MADKTRKWNCLSSLDTANTNAAYTSGLELEN